MDMVWQILKGKTIYRVLFNRLVAKHCFGLSGDVLDLAGGTNPSYREYLPLKVNLIVTDLVAASGAGRIDLNKPLQIDSGRYRSVLCFNALYIVENMEGVLLEMRRILAPGGKLFISMPFISNEMPEPHDYRRLTKEGLVILFRRAGFTKFEIMRFGERFSSAAYLLHPFFLCNPIRLLVYCASLLLDRMIPKKIKELYPTPLGYFCVLSC